MRSVRVDFNDLGARKMWTLCLTIAPVYPTQLHQALHNESRMAFYRSGTTSAASMLAAQVTETSMRCSAGSEGRTSA